LEPEAIRTVSKHGYRFEPVVWGEPGLPRATYERFARARELTAQRSLAAMAQARELLWITLAEARTTPRVGVAGAMLLVS